MRKRNQWSFTCRGPRCKAIDDHCLVEDLNVTKKQMIIASQKALM